MPVASRPVGLPLRGLAVGAFVAVMLTAFGGCGSSSASVGSTGDGQATFTNIYTSILQPACATHHSGGASASGALDMSSQALAFSNLVGVKAAGSACGTSGDIRVVAGSPTESLLYNKVNGTQSCGAQMPLGGPYLPADEISLIEAWITAGAMNN
jgi:hypothetical protein